jgi:Fe-S-cluster containining protein
MNIDNKHAALREIYSIYDDFTSSLILTCKRNCAHCCTRNVLCTTLEGYHIYKTLKNERFAEITKKIHAHSHENRYQPRITLNQMAQAYIHGEEITDDSYKPDSGKCPILSHKECPIYPVRPFSCRCLVSKTNCGEFGYADMDSFTLTVNQVFMQVIEHMDASSGYTGNFSDIVPLFSSKDMRHRYCQGGFESPSPTIKNHPMTALLIPPEHKERIDPILKAIRSINS